MPDVQRAFALTIPGLGPVLRAEAADLGLRPGPVERDGRADVVPLAVADRARLRRLRTAEDLFAEVAVVPPARSAPATARLVDAASVRAAAGGRPLRLVVRVRQEGGHTRSALRDALARRLGAVDDEAATEVWALETDPRRLRVGVRLAGLGTRARPPRAVERPGALRPAVAAAMVRLAGAPVGVLLDPCCGSGTIVEEAAAVGWRVVGGDLDVDALAATGRNTAATCIHGDTRRLPLPARAVAAVVTNLPFDHQHRLEGSPVAWYRRALQEAVRVAPVVVVLAPPSPPFRQALGRLPVDVVERHPLVLLGRPATIWVLRRRSPRSGR